MLMLKNPFRQIIEFRLINTNLDQVLIPEFNIDLNPKTKGIDWHPNVQNGVQFENANTLYGENDMYLLSCDMPNLKPRIKIF